MWKQKYRKIVAGTLATLTFLLQMPLELLAQNLYDSAEENYQQISQKAEEESLTLDELSQTNILPTTRRNRGVVESPLDLNTHRPTNRNTRGELIGFYGANSLRDDSSPVSVIVVFNEAPLAVQRALEAQPQRANQRITLSLDAAAAIEAERQLFHEELGSLISYASAQTNSNSPNPVSVNREFSHAFNGVSLTLPSNTVEYLASFESVSIVFPDQIYQLDPILIGDEIEEDLIAFSQSNPIGVRLGRERMNAHILHEMGYRGQGILMAILDTGVYT
ncbi:MAG: protease inhibitor I9 family protein, partial [Defluviitaleaceae bacterium]|nr:protease inhibitor I9 family protein [Defluviitaleaceae bacterium]